MTLILLALNPAMAGELGSAEAPLDEVYAPRRVAVLVGVDRYDDPALTPLKFAAKDASDLGAVLEDASYGAFDRVVTITSTQATTRAGIEKALDFATADLQRDDTFLLYLSGHGTLTIDPMDGSRLWFLPSDGQLADAQGTGISVEWLEARVADVEARRRVLIMDTCHNGRDKSSLDASTAALLAGMRGEPPAPRGLREVSESEARLFAAQYYQPAMEDPTLQNGVYTHFLIQAISDAASESDLDGDGLVDVTEAHDWARDKTIAYTGSMQVPRAEYRIVGKEEIYLAGSDATRTAAERALLAATDTLLASARVLVDGTPRGVLPQVVPVEPGFHQVEVQDEQGRTLLKKSVRLSAGETVMVEDLFPDMRSSFELLGGGAYRHGPGAGVFHLGATELEAAMVSPGMGPNWLMGGVHLRGTWGLGGVPSTSDWTTARTGDASLGGHVALRTQRIPLTVGPTLDAGMAWRQASNYQGTHTQYMPVVSPGARVALRIPVGDERYLVARYDTRVMPFTYGDASEAVWTSYVQHGISIGLGQHR